jgi:hypothetical protein
LIGIQLRKQLARLAQCKTSLGRDLRKLRRRGASLARALQFFFRALCISLPERRLREQQSRVAQIGFLLQRILQLDDRDGVLSARDLLARTLDAHFG